MSSAPARGWRSVLASLVWTLGALCALCLAVGALLVGLHADQQQPVPALVSLLVDAADRLTGRRVIDLHGRDAAVKEVLLTWGLAAGGYLAVARVADRILRGPGRRG